MAKPPKAPAAEKAAAKTIRRNNDKKLTNRPAAKSGKKIDKRGTPKGKATTKSPKGGAIGNPPYVPTAVNRQIVETHAAVGTPHWVIAELLVPPISERTLERHYDRELNLGLHKMNARVGSGIAKKALKGEDGYDKFWISRRGGPAWASKAELSTPPGRPFETRDMSGLSVEELEVLAKINDARPSAGD